jgi:hypothetical protein
LLQWLATKHAPRFQTFARQCGGGLVLSTVETQALKSYCKLTKNQLLNLCGFFGSRYRIKLRNNPTEIKNLQSCTGKLPKPVFGVYDYDNPKHGLDVCKFWTLHYGEEVERAADELLLVKEIIKVIICSNLVRGRTSTLPWHHRIGVSEGWSVGLLIFVAVV